MRSRTRTSLRLLFVALLTVVTGQIFIRDAQAYRLDPPEISVYARNESDARSHVDMMCNSGYPVGHGGYVHDIWLDEETGKLTWSVTTISRRCDSTDATATTLYAVTGYDGICPVAGWYNKSADTHDCIKYQNPASMVGVSKCGGPYPINDCAKYGNWWSIVKGSGTQPSTNYTYRTYSEDGKLLNMVTESLCLLTIRRYVLIGEKQMALISQIKDVKRYGLRSNGTPSGICLVSPILVKMGEYPAVIVMRAIAYREQLRVLGQGQPYTGTTGCVMTVPTAFQRHLTCRLILIQSVVPLVEVVRAVSK